MHEPKIELLNMDCLLYMKQCEDKQFDLAIVDPPYGIGMDSTHFKTKSSNAKPTDYGKKDWDNAIPNKEYFNELLRVSKHQIVWGGNYFVENLTNSSCWVVWDKDNGDSIHADCELAWTSFKTGVKKVKWLWHGMRQQNMKNKEKRIHPTQKPKALYEWLLMNYAESGNKIIDTHLGSGSIALACYDLKFDLVGIEIDNEYFQKASKRLELHKKQLTLF
ncbi:MAG TPA: DNA methyltransferase [Niabella sp.]|nr:DNA methyltransferase [Niabella sp.]